MNAAIYGGGILAKGRKEQPTFMYKDATDETLSNVGRFEALCQRYDVPIAAAALQFSLRDPRITSTVVGTSRPERVGEIVGHATLSIPDEFWTELSTLPFSTVEGV